MEHNTQRPLTHYEMIEHLKQRYEAGYVLDREVARAHLSRVTLLAVLGPTAAGKSTLVNKVVAMEPTIQTYLSSTTRPRASRDGDDYRTSVPVDEFYHAANERSLVNYYVHPSGTIYGTFLDGFKAPVTIGAIGTSTLEQLRAAPFQNLQAIYTVMEGDTFASRLGLHDEANADSRIRQPDILPRLQEGLASLSFARENLHQNYLTALELNNEPHVLDDTANDVINLAFNGPVESASPERAHALINEMVDVLHEASRYVEARAEEGAH